MASHCPVASRILDHDASYRTKDESATKIRPGCWKSLWQADYAPRCFKDSLSQAAGHALSTSGIREKSALSALVEIYSHPEPTQPEHMP